MMSDKRAMPKHQKKKETNEMNERQSKKSGTMTKAKMNTKKNKTIKLNDKDKICRR